MKTITNISISENDNKVVVNFINDIGQATFLPYTKEDFTTLLAFNNEVQAKLDALPKTKATVRYVNLLNETFSISGEFYPLKTQKIVDLTVPQIAVVDALKAFILSYTGVALTSLEGELGTHSVSINGVFYSGQAYLDMVTASNGAIVNAIMLTIQIFNS